MSQYNEITEKKYCRAKLSKIHLPLGGGLESLSWDNLNLGSSDVYGVSVLF